MSDRRSGKTKRPKHQPNRRTPWLDPTAQLTDEEERALDAIFARIPRAVVDTANRETKHHQQKEPSDNG